MKTDRECSTRTVSSLRRIVDDEVAPDDKRPSDAHVQRILERLAILVEHDGITQLEYGPVVGRLVLGDGAYDGDLLAPADLALVDTLHARRGGTAPSSHHCADFQLLR